jgi:hypothetical protein
MNVKKFKEILVTGIVKSKERILTQDDDLLLNVFQVLVSVKS